MVQALAVVHDTPLNWAPGTLGVFWIDHAVPFHTSASEELPEPVVAAPTAMQNVAEAQETPVSVADSAPAGLGVLRTDHAVPFHDSASVTPTVVRPTRPPTAMQALADVHDKAVS